MSVLNKIVSYYPSTFATKENRDVYLLAILKSAKHREAILKLRATVKESEQDRLKNLLPCYTVAGTFRERKEAGLIQLSGLAAIDLDGAEGYDLSYLLKALQKLPCIAYAGLSCRGKRLFAIIPFQHPELYVRHYNRLIRSFEDFGLPIGYTCHKQISQPRFVSYNTPQTCFFNHNALPYTLLEPEKIIHTPKKRVCFKSSGNQLFSFSWCVENHNTRHTFEKGKRHPYILNLAGFCKEMGGTESEVLTGCLDFIQPDFDESEITDIVKWIYSAQAKKNKPARIAQLTPPIE